MANLPTNYKDGVLDESVNTEKRYLTVNNPDGTISLRDATAYLQQPSKYGAGAINNVNEEINNRVEKEKVAETLQEIKSLEGEGYVAGAHAVKELDNKLGGCWIEFADVDGNPTTEPYVHWYAEEEV